MKAVKPLRLSFLHRTFDHDQKHHLVATVLVGFDLADPKKIMPEVDVWKMLGGELGRFTVFDHCMWKPSAEVLVTGACVPPGGVPAADCQIGLRVFRKDKKLVDKSLLVFGDRHWEVGGASPPEPFLRMPIDYAHAFGGEGFDSNPSGLGLTALEVEGAKRHPLPNVEDPRRPMKSKGDRPKPASLGPWDLTWPVHFKKMGTYDKRWKEELFPGLAEDIDWSIFNVAPEDQRLEGWFTGEETFQIVHMHPTEPVLEVSLPEVVGRCLLREKGNERLVELPLRLETVHLFPTAGRGVLIFRGVRPIKSQDASDIEIGLAALELRGAPPRPLEHYENALALRLDREKGYLHLLRDSDLLPAELGLTISTTDTDPITSVVQLEGLGMRNARARMQWELDKSKKQLRDAGVDPSHFESVELPAEEELPQGPEDMPDFAERTTKRMEAARTEGLAAQVELETRVRALCAENGIDFDNIVANAKKEGLGPPKFSAEAELDKLRDMYALSLTSGVPLPHVEAELDDPKLRERLELAERRLHEAYVKTGHFQDPTRPMTEDESARARELLLVLAKTAAPAGKRDFSGADLSGIDLSGADLSGIYLEGAVLREAKLDGAKLDGAVLTHADLTGASLDGASLVGANFGRAKLVGANLARTNLSEAVFYEADLSRAVLDGADLRGAQLFEVRLEGADLSRTKAERMFFLRTSFAGVRFIEAEYTECAFVETDLTGTDFSRACIRKTAFLKVNGDGAKLEDADLENLRVVHGSSFVGASFARSKLPMSNFRGTALREANFEGADVSRSDFSDCDMTGANLYRVVAVEARFVGTDLTSAKLRGANLMLTILHRTILRGVDATGANLFAADMSGTIGDDKTTFSGSLVKRVVTTKGGARASD